MVFSWSSFGTLDEGRKEGRKEGMLKRKNKRKKTQVEWRTLIPMANRT